MQDGNVSEQAFETLMFQNYSGLSGRKKKCHSQHSTASILSDPMHSPKWQLSCQLWMCFGEKRREEKRREEKRREEKRREEKRREEKRREEKRREEKRREEKRREEKRREEKRREGRAWPCILCSIVLLMLPIYFQRYTANKAMPHQNSISPK